jgi:hypothetical protein
MHFFLPSDVVTLRPSHPSWFNHPNCFIWRVRIWKLLVMWCQFFYFVCFSSKYSPLHLLQQRAICTDLGWYPYGITWYVGPPDHQIWVSGNPRNAPKESDREEFLACNREHIHKKNSVFRHAKLLKSSIICDITLYNLVKVSYVWEEHIASIFSAFCLLHTGLLIVLLFDPEDGGDVLLQKVSWRSLEYTALCPRAQNSSQPPLWEPEIERAKLLLMKICKALIANNTSVDTSKPSEEHLYNAHNNFLIFHDIRKLRDDFYNTS